MFRNVAIPSVIAFGILMVAARADGACFGTPGLQTCYDGSGNSYTVNRLGNMTTMNGYNANTGSNWSENSQTLGNMTIHNGMTNGRPWNMNEQSYGGITTYSGMNSAGQPFFHTCTAYGGCN